MDTKIDLPNIVVDTVGRKIATEYGVSESYVGSLRGEMKKENPDG